MTSSVGGGRAHAPSGHLLLTVVGVLALRLQGRHLEAEVVLHHPQQCIALIGIVGHLLDD
eukprot:6243717-Pyramimonas_sp.AAC.1